MNDNSIQSIRTAFIDFFKQKNHEHLPYSPLIPKDDPSLMFVNSGMVQFKDIFTGQENASVKRAVTHQKCIRAGGKHNDLDNVGYTNRHHTFFEMLGNFSFGDYFKEEAITYAWDLITKIYDLPEEKLIITVHHTDEEAFKIWKKLTNFPDARIIKISTNDNFWSMGETGPCGPCSEIFYDHGPHIAGGLPGSKEQDGNRYVEIWNIVFMQFAQIDANTRITLANKSIDTGMGIERITAALQGVNDTYEIDLFQKLIATAKAIARKPYEEQDKVAYKIITDHVRSISFLIADGVSPSNEGRGYVLRRIMRRAMRYASHLAQEQSILKELSAQVIDLMSGAYSELSRAANLITQTIAQEEHRFKDTLRKGLIILDKVSKKISKGGVLSGKVAFELYDTYGFPLDLTTEILQASQIKINQAEFDLCMHEQKERAKKQGSFTAKADSVWFQILNTYGPTKFTPSFKDCATIIAIVKEDKIYKSYSTSNDVFFFATDSTPFYGESGGQVGDIGTAFTNSARIKILNTKKILNKLHLHQAIIEHGEISEGEKINLHIDEEYRRSATRNHSATHILQAVLLNEIEGTIMQKGSLVTHDRLRFDFSHTSALSMAQIQNIELKVNEIITANVPVSAKHTTIEDAIKDGATALFGEKYENEVRVISIGTKDLCYSKELCGGTHVNNTGQIGGFKILSESAVASGIRRIEAVTGKYVIINHQKDDALLSTIATNLGCPRSDIISAINTLTKKYTNLVAQNRDLQISTLVWNVDKISQKGIKISNGLLVYEEFANVEVKCLKDAAIKTAKNGQNLIVVFVSSLEEKSLIITSVSEAISDKISALEVLLPITEMFKSKGGGNTLVAQTGVATPLLKDYSLLKNLQKILSN